MRLHLICERDVGLFSLIQQAIAHVPRALQEGRIPIVYFQDKTCYWTPKGYHGKDTVWEYYFEPVMADYPAASIPARRCVGPAGTAGRSRPGWRRWRLGRVHN